MKSKKMMWGTIAILIVVGFVLTGIILREEHTELSEVAQNCEHAGMAISTSGASSFAIQSDNSLWAWGSNNHGQLGDSTTTNRQYPVRILEDVIVVSAGVIHTMAIKTDGSLWTWGSNEFGNLGDGTVTIYGDFHWDAQYNRFDREIIEDNNQRTPIKIMEDVVAVSVGWSHALAIRTDGSLWAWGSNSFGALGGDGITTDTHYPIRIMEDVTAVSAGWTHTMAIRTDGSLWAWGNNEFGQLGNGIIAPVSNPTPVRIMENVIAVSADKWHTMAIMSDGSLWAWGPVWEWGPVSELDPVLEWDSVSEWDPVWEWGIVDAINHPNPTIVMEDVACVSGSMAIAIKTDGSLATIDRYHPIRIKEDVVAISGSEGYTLTIRSDGSLWGFRDCIAITIRNIEDNIEVNYQHHPIRILDNVLLPIGE